MNWFLGRHLWELTVFTSLPTKWLPSRKFVKSSAKKLTGPDRSGPVREQFPLIARGLALGCGCTLGRSGHGNIGEQFANPLGELGAVASPVVDAIALDVDRCGGGAGIVDADHFDGTAVAGAILFNDDDTIVGLFACAYARQTNH